MDTDTLLSLKRSYNQKPFLRRNKTCKAIIAGAGGGAYFLIFVASRLGEFSENGTFRASMAVVIGIGILAFVSAILFVCIVAITGPIYTRQIDFSQGRLETWGFVEKGILVLVSAMFLAAIGLIGYRALHPAEFVDARTPTNIGDVQLQISEARIGKVALKTILDFELDSENDLLTIRLTITNSRLHEDVSYTGFRQDFPTPKLVDNDGKNIRQVQLYPKYRIQDALSSGSIHPGESITDAIVFELPSENAEYFNLTLPASACGEEGKFRIRIPENMIQR